ncbi:MAG: Rab family GTPase, partial [Candidatus Hodarchaeales archaeon]
LGVDITTKKIFLDDLQVKLILVDTAGEEFFGKLRPSYYRGASAAILFFNRNNPKSLKEIPNLIREFHTYIQPKVPLALVGITSTRNIVSTREALRLAKLYNLHYFECRSKTCPKLAKAFAFLARQVISPSSSQEEMTDSLIYLLSLYLSFLSLQFFQFLAHLVDIFQGKFSGREKED